MGPYIADFVCYKKNLIVELDGSAHFSSWRARLHDRRRDAYFRRNGIRVLRFQNHALHENMEGVLESIGAALGIDR